MALSPRCFSFEPGVVSFTVRSGHFLAYAARVMRPVSVDFARDCSAQRPFMLASALKRH
jgi:hypothetical protein